MEPATAKKPPRDRVKVHISLMLSTPIRPQPFIFTTENISETGILIQGERDAYPFEEAESFKSWLYPIEGDEAAIEFTARLVRWAGISGLALEITGIDKRNEDMLDAYLKLCRMLGKSLSAIASAEQQATPE